MKFLLFMSILIQCSNAKVQLCDVETGQTNIILDIEESRGDREFLYLFYIYFFHDHNCINFELQHFVFYFNIITIYRNRPKYVTFRIANSWRYKQ
jgi:hypothetical protein